MVGTFDTKNLDDIDNKRLARLKEKTNWWRSTTMYNLGKAQQTSSPVAQEQDGYEELLEVSMNMVQRP